MKCKHIQKKLTVGEPLLAHEKSHLNRCQTCLACQADLAFLQHDFYIETPKDLKNRVLQNSLRVLTTGTVETWKSKVAAIPLSSFIVGVGVLMAFIIAALYVLNIYCTEATVACRFLFSLLILIFLQNAITALFVPLFLQKKLNIHF